MNFENSKECKSLEIKITEATGEDAESIQEVFYQTWVSTYPNKEYGVSLEDIQERFRGAFTEAGLLKRKEQIELFLRSSEEKMFVARGKNNRVIGLCRLERRGSLNELRALYVLPEFQGMGVGCELLSIAQKFFGLKESIVVHVAVYNKKAIDFYRKNGFSETGRSWDDEQFRLKSGAIIPEIEMLRP